MYNSDMELLIGTNNKFKQKEMLWHLEGLEDVNFHFLSELEEKIDVEEDGKTLLQNAEKKAREISQHADWYVLTSDAGVDIPGLKEKWEMTKPQRIVGHDRHDLEKLETLIGMMKGLKGDERFCQFHFALALAHNGEIIWSEEVPGESGVIVEDYPKGPIAEHTWMARAWFYPELGRTDEELSPEERAEIRQQHQSAMKQDLQNKIRSL